MEPPCMLREEEQESELQKSEGETKQVDDDDDELILVGGEHVNEDAEVIFVGMTSTSKPVVSNILNRVTPCSCSRRKRYGHFRKGNTHKLQAVSHVTPTSEAKTVLPVSDSESRSTDSPIIIEPLSQADYNNISPQIMPNSFSKELCSSLITFTSSLQHPVRTAVSAGDRNKSPHVSGGEHVNEDADVIFVGMTSTSKPVVSNILNRVIPGSCSRRKRYGHFRKGNTHKLQSVSHVIPTSEAKTVLPVSDSESRSTDSPIIIEPLSQADYKNISPQIVPNSFSKELCSSLITFTSSLQHPVETAVSAGDRNKSPHASKRLSTSETNSTNPKRPKLSDGIIGEHCLALSPSGIFHTVTTQQSTPDCVHTSLSHVQKGEPSPTPFAKDSVHCKPVKPLGENGLTKTDFPRLASPNKIVDPTEGNLIVLLRDFYYGEHIGVGQPEPKTHMAFKCLSCLKVLKNVKFMNHMKHHLELERQRGDSWKNHTTCQHCHCQFAIPFELQCHIESVHTPQELSAVCKICELSFETDQVLLQHMKDNHKPCEMPYVCQVCSYRSSFFADVDAHFRAYHGNTKNLLCPFCLKIFKTAAPYKRHYRRHWEKSFHQCSKCRLQFLTFKEKMEHKTQCYQMFKKPKQLEGLSPETKVVIQVSLEPLQPGLVEVASITLNTCDSESSPPNLKLGGQK